MKPHIAWLRTSLIFLLLLGCSISKALPTGGSQQNTDTSSPAQTNYKWEVSVTGAREEKQLHDSSGTTYTPNPGFTFLVVDVVFHNTDASSKTEIADTEIKVIDAAGNEFENVGSGFGFSYSLGGSSTYSNDQSDKITMSLVFSVNAENINQDYTFQVKDAAPVTFSLTD